MKMLMSQNLFGNKNKVCSSTCSVAINQEPARETSIWKFKKKRRNKNKSEKIKENVEEFFCFQIRFNENSIIFFTGRIAKSVANSNDILKKTNEMREEK